MTLTPGSTGKLSSSRIRLATTADAASMLAIYEPIVSETAISFELEPPSEVEFRRRVADTMPRTPWLVCEIDGKVAGYTYAGAYRTRAAYQWSVEVTVYVSADHQRRGVGKALYTSLFACLSLLGYRSAYAAIVLPNEASIRLHEGVGFAPIGVFSAVGHKLGKWHDIGWWQRVIAPHTPEPAAPTQLSDVSDSAEFQRALESGLNELTS